MLLAVPSFVPLSHLSGIFENLLSPSGGITKLLFTLGLLEEKQHLLAIKKNFVPIYIAFETLRYMFFPVLAGVIALDKRDTSKISASLKIALAYILVRISMTFIGGNEMIISLYRPVTYEVSDTITSFIYRRGLLENDFGMSAAFEIFRFIAQLVINIGVFFGLKALFASRGNSLSKAEKTEPASHHSNPLIPVISIIAYIILASGAIFVLASLVFPRLIVEGSVLSFEGFKKIKDIGIYFFNSFIYAIPRAIIFASISFILAYPLTTRSKSLWPPILIALSAGSLTLMNYLVLNEIGLLNTVIGTILFSSFSCVGAVALAFGLRGKLSATPALQEYACAAWRGTLVLFLLGFALSWGSTMYSFSPPSARTMYPISIVLKEFVQFGGLGNSDLEVNYSLTSGIMLVSALPPLAAVWSALLLQKKLPAGLLSAGFRA
jgi:ABC-type glycerol-3-phosphate transport system permease component